jgi:hypothetical protein
VGWIDLHRAIRSRSDGCGVVGIFDCSGTGGGVMNDEQFFGWLRRQGKPESKALPSWQYGNPENFTALGQGKGVTVERISETEQADVMLMEWYRWSKAYRPNLGAQRIAPYCRQSVSSKQYEEASDLTHDRVYQNEMHAVEYCVDALAVPLQQAIGSEMRNREVKAKVWRDPGNASYREALEAVVPVMRKRGLFD